MALYLPIRAISRSQQIRVGGTRITRDATFYVDISDGATRRDLERHQAFGAIITVGALTASNSAIVIASGGEVTANSSPDQSVDVAAGEVRDRSAGTYVAFAAVNDLAQSAAHATLVRKDIVQVHTTTGTVSKKDGTASATPVAPAVDTANILLAVITRAATDNTISSGDIADARVRP